MERLKGKESKVGTIIYNHIINNKREYLIITILFFIGLITSVIFINNVNIEKLNETNRYLINLVNNIKAYENIDLFKLLKSSVWNNIAITLILWFGASTIIGIPIVYGTAALKGFSIGCTISSIISAFGIGSGIIISLSFLLLHNIIFIPTMFAICVSGVKLYKSIMRNKQRENIKLEILRHTIFCGIMLVFMLISSIVEVYLSTNIAMILLKYIKI